MIGVEYIVLIACIFAGLGRTGLPYLRKWKDAAENGQELPFDRKYLYTAVFSIVGSIIIGILLFPTIIGSVPSDATGIAIFASAFGLAWASNDIINQIISTGSGTQTVKKKEEEKELP